VLETGGSDFGEEEEDVKPSIEYLNSLNEYRKRSRSTEDVGFSTSNSGKKVVKLGYDNPGSGPIIASTTPMLEALVKEQPLDVEVTLPQGEDPIVYGTLFITVLTPSPPALICCFPPRSEWRTYAVLNYHGRTSRADDARRVHDLLRGIPAIESVTHGGRLALIPSVPCSLILCYPLF